MDSGSIAGRQDGSLGAQRARGNGLERIHGLGAAPHVRRPYGGLRAASGIPLLALDLRAAPKTGPVAEWLHAAHATRSIGALYSENLPNTHLANQVAPETCDALLFVEKTTAARKNPPLGGSSRR